MCFHELVYSEGTGITARFTFPDMLVKVVGVERAKQATARHGRKAPGVSVVIKALAPCPAHVHKGVSVREKRLLALLGPAPFLPHDTHMELMSVDIKG